MGALVIALSPNVFPERQMYLQLVLSHELVDEWIIELSQWFRKYGPKTGSIAWELVRKVNLGLRGRTHSLTKSGLSNLS